MEKKLPRNSEKKRENVQGVKISISMAWYKSLKSSLKVGYENDIWSQIGYNVVSVDKNYSAFSS